MFRALGARPVRLTTAARLSSPSVSLTPLFLNAIGADQRFHLIREAHMSLFPLIPNWIEMDGQMDNSVAP